MVFDFGVAFSRLLWILTDNPAYMIILLLTIFAYAFSFFGVLKIYEWISTWKKLRAGWIRLRKKLSNGRWVEFWAKPTGRKVKIKGEEGMIFELPVKIEKDYMGFQSNIKGDFKKASKKIVPIPDLPLPNPNSNEDQFVIERTIRGLSPKQFEDLKKMVKNGEFKPSRR